LFGGCHGNDTSKILALLQRINSRMRILLSNDDGYQAPGIQILASALRAAGHDVWIVAPNEEKSGNSHAISILRPLLTKQVAPQAFAVFGTPADAVAVGLAGVMKDAKPDVVISGINNGYNVGRDVNYSGTIGAATEAALEGYKAIAVSMEWVTPSRVQQLHDGFERVAALIVKTLENFEHIPWPHMEVLSLNHPATEARGVRLAECNSTNLYAPEFERLTMQQPRLGNMTVYLMGGDVRPNIPESSEDVSLVQAGYAIYSFLQARQSSTAHTAKLNTLMEHLEGQKTS
jgi:5'-nucleotidase